MHLYSRGRLDSTAALARRGATAVAVAAVLGAAVFVPGASAGPVEDVTAMIEDYAADGSITPCRFTKADLTLVRSAISPDFDEYAPDFGFEVDRQIGLWKSGACSPNATIRSVKVAKNRRSAKVKLYCPAAGSSACRVTLSGTLAGRKAAARKASTVAPNSTKTVKVKLTNATSRRLSAKGGKLKISARTAGSALAPASRAVKVARQRA